MDDMINGDLAAQAVADTNLMEWSPSPSGTVWRKRVHLVGLAESGQVTSVVRYDPGATFPEHAHPGGEEILVLDGVFSDEHGNWPKGTYLLNPESFRHAPFSKYGCVIFVKLRQFPGAERIHVAIQTAEQAWQPGTQTGAEVKTLYEQDGFTDTMRLERWSKNRSPVDTYYSSGAELFVIDGDFYDEDARYGAGTWLRFPAGSSHTPKTNNGCTLYIKEGGFSYLDTAV